MRPPGVGDNLQDHLQLRPLRVAGIGTMNTDHLSCSARPSASTMCYGAAAR